MIDHGGGGMTVTFLGVSGSYAAQGRGTSCVLVRQNGRALIFDMGTGLARLQGIDEADILLSHYHYDHIGGMPFFEPFFTHGRFDVYAAPPAGSSVKAALSDYMRHPYWPITVSQFTADLNFHDIQGDRFRLDSGAEVRTVPLNHPGGATGYRVDWGGRSLAYVCDHECGGDESALVKLCHNCDMVIYDAFFVKDEIDSGRYEGWGHSHHTAGIALAELAGAKRIAFTHHAPWRTDTDLARLAAETAARFPGAVIATEDLRVDLETGD